MSTETHYGYGSGLTGCLYDNGPCYSGTNKRSAAYAALAIFEECLTQAEYSEAVQDLVDHNFYRFPADKRGECGADYVEIFEVDPADWADEIDAD